MTERLQPSVILVTTFIGVSVLLIGITSDITGWGAIRSDVPEGFDAVGITINFWNPTNGTEVSDEDPQIHIGEYPQRFLEYAPAYANEDNYYAFTPPYGSLAAIRVWVIRENPQYVPGSTNWFQSAYDFFLVTQHSKTLGFVTKIHKTIVPFETVIHQIEGNRSIVFGILGSLNFTMLLFHEENLAEALLTNDGYTICVGTGFLENLGKTSIWSIIGRLLTMRLPDCHPVINALLAIPIWIGIGFIVVTIILRALPFVGGG